MDEFLQELLSSYKTQDYRTFCNVISENIDKWENLPEHKIFMRSIISDSEFAYFYALLVIKGRWPICEEKILDSKNLDLAFAYAKYVIKGRWFEAEPLFLSDPMAAQNYAMYVIGGRWHDAEPIIASNYVSALRYAYSIKKRFTAGEKAIASNAETSFLYARDIIKGRWKPGEASMKHANDGEKWIRSYIKNVIKSKIGL